MKTNPLSCKPGLIKFLMRFHRTETENVIDRADFTIVPRHCTSALHFPSNLDVRSAYYKRGGVFLVKTISGSPSNGAHNSE